MSDGACGTFGSTVVVGGAPAQTLADGCHRFVLTGTNALGLAATLTTTVKADSTAPAGAVLTVNGVNATPAGSSSSGTGSNAISAATPFADTQSGMSENLMIRSFAPLDGPGCGAFDAGSSLAIATANDAAPGPGCYRYTLSGVNRAGTSAAVFTVVRVTP